MREKHLEEESNGRILSSVNYAPTSCFLKKEGDLKAKTGEEVGTRTSGYAE